MSKFLKTISELNGVPGNETQVRNFMRDELTDFVDEVLFDGIGSVVDIADSTAEYSTQVSAAAKKLEDINSLYAVAQPSLLSSTSIKQTPAVSLGTNGRLFTYFCSTEKPTPVPQRRMNNTSSKQRTWSMGVYEQLYPLVLSLDKALPAVINALIDGITSRFKIASSISLATCA